MIGTLLLGLLNFFQAILALVILPINNLLEQYVPEVSQAFGYITAFLYKCVELFGWAVGTVGISDWVISFVVTALIFKLTLPTVAFTIKYLLKWYRTLMP